MDEGEQTQSGRPTDSDAPVPLDDIPLHSTNLLTVLDEDGVIRYESPSVERIYGFEQADMVGDPVADYFHPDDRDRVLQAYQAVVESDDYREAAVEYRHETADGSYLWVESVASANPTPDGHYVINTRDVSERRATEQALRHANDRLDEFASVVSHDLRNPLNVAASRLELAADHCESEHLGHAMEAVERGLGLIDDVQSLATLGHDELEAEPVRLATAVDRSWRTVETKDASLDNAADRTVHANPGRLRQLLENLLRNAVEHGGDDVTVRVGDLPDGFYLEDDGPGIPEEGRDEVFDVGYSTKRDGTGFGLGIVSQVAENHGWDVSVVDSDTGGSRFEITGVVTEG